LVAVAAAAEEVDRRRQARSLHTMHAGRDVSREVLYVSRNGRRRGLAPGTPTSKRNELAEHPNR
jgi:hypothetical protein